MWPRLSILLGLVAGVAVGVLVIAGLLFLTPDPGSGTTATPSPTAQPAASPSPSPAASPSPTPSASPKAPASPSASEALVHTGRPAALVVPKVSGSTRTGSSAPARSAGSGRT